MVVEAVSNERRTNKRFIRLASCTLIQFENHWVGQIINLSKKGVLVRTRQALELESDQMTVHVELNNGHSVLMHCEVVHRRRNIVGLKWQAQNLDEAERLELLLA